MAAVSTAKSGAAHCWALVLIVADCRAMFDAEIQRTSCSYGMYSPIWDVSGAPGGAGQGAIEKSGSGRTPGPQNSS